MRVKRRANLGNVFVTNPEGDAVREIERGDRGVENWLQDHVGPAFYAILADPTRTVTVAQLRARLAVAHKILPDDA